MVQWKGYSRLFLSLMLLFYSPPVSGQPPISINQFRQYGPNNENNAIFPDLTTTTVFRPFGNRGLRFPPTVHVPDALRPPIMPMQQNFGNGGEFRFAPQRIFNNNANGQPRFIGPFPPPPQMPPPRPPPIMGRHGFNGPFDRNLNRAFGITGLPPAAFVPRALPPPRAFGAAIDPVLPYFPPPQPSPVTMVNNFPIAFTPNFPILQTTTFVPFFTGSANPNAVFPPYSNFPLNPNFPGLPPMTATFAPQTLRIASGIVGRPMINGRTRIGFPAVTPMVPTRLPTGGPLIPNTSMSPAEDLNRRADSEPPTNATSGSASAVESTSIATWSAWSGGNFLESGPIIARHTPTTVIEGSNEPADDKLNTAEHDKWLERTTMSTKNYPTMKVNHTTTTTTTTTTAATTAVTKPAAVSNSTASANLTKKSQPTGTKPELNDLPLPRAAEVASSVPNPSPPVMTRPKSIAVVVPDETPPKHTIDPNALKPNGCAWDLLTNTCKDIFNLKWCGECRDFGNALFHDCKCVAEAETIVKHASTA